MDILTFFDILLKPPQPFTGLFFDFTSREAHNYRSFIIHFPILARKTEFFVGYMAETIVGNGNRGIFQK